MKRNTIKKRLYFSAPIIFLTVLSFSYKPVSVNSYQTGHQNLLADTTAFTGNADLGWSVHTSYLEDRGDSIEFELILFRAVPANNNWSDTSEAGIIRADYAPDAERIIEYVERPRTWKIIIRTNGQCVFQLLSGLPPDGENIVLPIITKYKK
jgi:hypothetical protein